MLPMKHFLLVLCFLMLAGIPLLAQDDYYQKKAESYAREADEKAAMFLRWAADALRRL